MREKGKDMGFVHVTVQIASPTTPDVERQVDLLVDTGAIFSVIPRQVLEALGVQPVGRRRFRAFGGVVEKEVGAALIKYRDDFAVMEVIFGERDDAPVMGVTTLETLGYRVNPSTGELEPTELLLL